jgi:hypothetical protein
VRDHNNRLALHLKASLPDAAFRISDGEAVACGDGVIFDLQIRPCKRLRYAKWQLHYILHDELISEDDWPSEYFGDVDDEVRLTPRELNRLQSSFAEFRTAGGVTERARLVIRAIHAINFRAGHDICRYGSEI